MGGSAIMLKKRQKLVMKTELVLVVGETQPNKPGEASRDKNHPVTFFVTKNMGISFIIRFLSSEVWKH